VSPVWSASCSWRSSRWILLFARDGSTKCILTESVKSVRILEAVAVRVGTRCDAMHGAEGKRLGFETVQFCEIRSFRVIECHERSLLSR
jgi:hypothetical protein